MIQLVKRNRAAQKTAINAIATNRSSRAITDGAAWPRGDLHRRVTLVTLVLRQLFPPETCHMLDIEKCGGSSAVQRSRGEQATFPRRTEDSANRD